MSRLTRNAPPLLRFVDGRPHASDRDHEPDPTRIHVKSTTTAGVKRRTYVERSIPTPDSLRSSQSGRSFQQKFVATEDVDRDPDSSSEAEGAKKSVSSSFRLPDTSILSDEGENVAVKTKTFSLPGTSQGSTKSNQREFVEDEEDEPDFMATRKKQRINGKAPVRNLFANPQPKKRYGRNGGIIAPRRKQNGFQKKDPVQIEKTPEKKASGFKKLSGLDVFDDITSGFKSSFSNDEFPDTGEYGNLSDDTSSISPPEPVEDDADSNVYRSVAECAHCGEEVPKIMYEEYLDRLGYTDDLPLRWQIRFCHHHKKERARETWQEKGYPDIDWLDLERRMRKHDQFLISVLHNTTGSHYRTEQRDKLQPRKKRAFQNFQTEDDEGCGSVGYYGPRGKKMMMDHIMETLSDDLRERATIDKLVSSSGSMGGVTGFVQAVLVPHLAELLIKDDMKLTDDWELRARDIISESAEVGDLMHPEARDEIEDVQGDKDVNPDDDN